MAMTTSPHQVPLHDDFYEEKLPEPLSDSLQMPSKFSDAQKRQLIAQACDDSNLDEIVKFVDSTGGLLDDNLRVRAWPILLGYSHVQSDSRAEKASWRSLSEHRDEQQVRLDVDRAFVYYPNNDSEKTRIARKDTLYDLIVSVLRSHPILSYFQGFHDIAQVLLLVLGEEAATAAVAQVSLLRIRDYMLPSISAALEQLKILPAIFKRADPILAARLSQTNPYYAVSATLTLYAHNVEDYQDIARLFDFILGHEPVMSLYLFAAIVISRRSELLAIPEDEPDMLNFQLSKLPNPLDLDALIRDALVLFQSHPPETLPWFVWRRLSHLSVLKTTRSLKQPQNLEEGETLFRRQVRQLERKKERQDLQRKLSVLLKKNKTPLASITAALVFAGFAFWIRRTGNDKAILSLWAGLARVIE